MSMRDAVCVLAALLTLTAVAAAKPPQNAPSLGAPITADDIAKWDLTIFPDGRGLPPGRGAGADGKRLFNEYCERCHGRAGRGATAEELVGPPEPPQPGHPNKTIGAYWPYATTLFDFIRRAKPPESPGSFSADQIYALVAYLLSANKVIGESEEMSAETLPKVKMPNRNGFIRINAP